MVKTYLKTFARMFKRHATRLISVFLMVVLSVGFSAGIGMSTDKMKYALGEIYKKDNVSDFIVRGDGDFSDKKDALGELGFEVETGGMIDFLAGETFSQTNEQNGMSVVFNVTFAGDGLAEAGVVRAYFYDSDEALFGQNSPSVLEESTEPLEEGLIPISVERATEQLCGFRLGDTFSAEVDTTVDTPFGKLEDHKKYTYVVTRVVQNPIHLAVRDDPSTTKVEGKEDEYEDLGAIFYITGQKFDVMGQKVAFPANSLYISSPALKAHLGDVGATMFDAKYEQILKTEKAQIEELFAEELSGETPTTAVLTLHENFTFESYDAYMDKIEMIGYVLMVVFVLVTLLVVLSTMTRLLDEERSQIACLMTLGYSPAKILTKYLLFALVGTLIGAVGGYFAAMGLSYVIYVNFNWNFTMPAFPAHVSLAFFMIVASVILVATLAATVIAGLRKMRERPANLLRPKSPRPGKKVIFERIPALWRRIPFKMKSTLRNVLRFKMRFIMTVVSVMASTALVFAGLAVLDCCIFQDIGTFAMIVVAIVVLVFAALLNAVVIYTLTNINISERERELATLMVLGYHDKEVTLYVYREIYITSAIGIVLGIPFGVVLLTFIFSLLSFGTVAGINVYVWLVAPVMSLLFTFLATLLLRRKIVKIDMNASLKAME